SGDKAFGFLAAKIRAMECSGRLNRLTIILHSGLTNEEWTEVAAFLAELPAEPNMRIADPPDRGGDDFLRTAERIPNRRGAAASGITLRPFDPEELRSKTDVLIVFTGIRGDLTALDRARPAWEDVGTKVLVTPVLTDLDPRFDFIFPCAIPYEKSGSYINIDGRRLEFAAVRPAPDEAMPEGGIFRALRAEFRRTAGAS
ncbi:MAG: hypothetical protein ACYDH3_02940, partial [Candidatus Aminicenantales bacterium]